MSTYSLMSRGPHPLAGLFMNLAGLDVRSVPRLRDAHLEVEDGVPALRVLCRAGGSNAADYVEELDLLMSHPNIISREDCGVDSTYCELWFTYRPEFHEPLARVAELLPMPPKFSDAFPHYLSAVQSNTPFPWLRQLSEEEVHEANTILQEMLNSLMVPVEGTEEES
jgi:hypothetical protein